jgi:hypothetical protein
MGCQEAVGRQQNSRAICAACYQSETEHTICGPESPLSAHNPLIKCRTARVPDVVLWHILIPS